MNEFEIIERFFSRLSPVDTDVLCGVGDDAAVVRFGMGNYAISTDTLIEGTHFPRSINAEDLGYRSAAVTLSDLAAMGAIPKFATLAITMPKADGLWLEQFSKGLGTALVANGCSLIGGDTTKGPLVITLQVMGQIKEKAIKRSGAQIGDFVGVSGSLGDARAALDFLEEEKRGVDIEFILSRYFRPIPRIKFALKAQKYLNSAIDISDGLVADLEHIALSSQVGIELDLGSLPISKSLESLFPRHKTIQYASSGGDDYELAFTADPSTFDSIKRVGRNLDLNISLIGRVIEGQGVVCRDSTGVLYSSDDLGVGYSHF